MVVCCGLVGFLLAVSLRPLPVLGPLFCWLCGVSPRRARLRRVALCSVSRVFVLVVVSWISCWLCDCLGWTPVWCRLSSLRAFFVSAVLFVTLVFGVSIDFAVFWSFGRFAAFWGVAKCPPGGEICGMSFRHLPPHPYQQQATKKQAKEEKIGPAE